MKFVMAVFIQVLLGLFLMWGMIQAVTGNFWLLLVSAAVYLVLFARAGCAAH